MKETWTFESCRNEALKYDNLTDFRNHSSKAYRYALKNNWNVEYTWLKRQKPRGYWNSNRCYNEAKKYTKLADFENYSGSAAASARKNGWIKYYTWLEKSGHSYDEIFEIALKYNYLKDFRKENEVLYNYALRHKWLNNYNWFEKNTTPYDGEVDCCYMYLNEQYRVVYIGRTIRPNERHNEHKYRNNGASAKFEKYGLELPEPIYYMDNAKFTVEYGLIIEDNLVQWFKENGWTVLNTAKTGVRSGSLGASKKIWSKKKVFDAANNCKTMKDFYTNYPSAYGVACSKKWLDELFPNRNKHLSKNNRSIKMFSMDGIYICSFKNQKDALSFVGAANYKTLRRCLYGNKESAFGYKWEWEIY